MTATVRDVVATLEDAYPPALAASWDAVGLVCGDPGEPVQRVLVAVDPVAETVAEALKLNAQLLVTHHPLLLRGVHAVRWARGRTARGGRCSGSRCVRHR